MFSSWPLAVSPLSGSFFGPRSVRHWPVVLPFCFVIGVTLGHITPSLLRAAPFFLRYWPVAAFLPCHQLGFWPLALSLAPYAWAAPLHASLSALSSARPCTLHGLFILGPHHPALLARRGVFLLFSRHGLWPFLLSLAPLSPLCAIGLSCSSFALSSARPYSYDSSPSSGRALLRCWPAAFLPCPQLCYWPLLLSLAACLGRASVRYGPVVLR